MASQPRGLAKFRVGYLDNKVTEEVIFFRNLVICFSNRFSKLSLREKSPNTEFFLVQLFPHSN